jgi:hypothetical protein
VDQVFAGPEARAVHVAVVTMVAKNGNCYFNALSLLTNIDTDRLRLRHALYVLLCSPEEWHFELAPFLTIYKHRMTAANHIVSSQFYADEIFDLLPLVSARELRQRVVIIQPGTRPQLFDSVKEKRKKEPLLLYRNEGQYVPVTEFC